MCQVVSQGQADLTAEEGLLTFESALLLRTGRLPWPVFQLPNTPPPAQGCRQHSLILLINVPLGQDLVGMAHLCSGQKVIRRAWLTGLEVNGGCQLGSQLSPNVAACVPAGSLAAWWLVLQVSEREGKWELPAS